jgi:hypothetical protein
MSSASKKYNCKKCTAYCCSYTRIEISIADITRLAKYFNITKRKAKQNFTKQYKFSHKETKINETVLRHKKDHIFDSVCNFLDSETRGCSIYDARPKVCRVYPDVQRCGYYEFLKFERKQQGDADFIPDC